MMILWHRFQEWRERRGDERDERERAQREKRREQDAERYPEDLATHLQRDAAALIAGGEDTTLGPWCITRAVGHPLTTIDLFLWRDRAQGLVQKIGHAWVVEMPDPQAHLHLSDIRLATKWRGRGGGSLLLDQVKDLARQAQVAYVDGSLSSVDDVNRLQAFYTRHGFTVTMDAAPEGAYVGRVEWRVS